MCTAFDIDFIIIYLLEKYASTAFRNLEEILSEAGGDYPALRNIVAKSKLALFCEKHVIAENNFWKLNTEKLLNFLKQRALHIANKLQDKNYNPPSQVTSYKRANQVFTDSNLFSLIFYSINKNDN